MLRDLESLFDIIHKGMNTSLHLVRQESVAKYTKNNGIRVYSIHELWKLTMLDSLSFENIFFEKQRV